MHHCKSFWMFSKPRDFDVASSLISGSHSSFVSRFDQRNSVRVIRGVGSGIAAQTRKLAKDNEEALIPAHPVNIFLRCMCVQTRLSPP